MDLKEIFYIIVLTLLLTVYFSGETVYGSKRWLSFGSLRIQPSEIAKISIILVYAFYDYTYHTTYANRFYYLYGMHKLLV